MWCMGPCCKGFPPPAAPPPAAAAASLSSLSPARSFSTLCRLAHAEGLVFRVCYEGFMGVG